MHNKIVVGAVLLDFSAAFDVNDNKLLLKKLICYGFTSPVITRLESYLSNRTQKLVFNGSFSNIRHTHCGVPQGSYFGPLLFSIFTNDLQQVLHKARMAMYVDDSILYMSALKASELTEMKNKKLVSMRMGD
jgi:hypothetical protein